MSARGACWLIAGLLWLAAPLASAAQMQLEVLALKHRTADQIVPILKPLVAEGGTVTGMNNQLIVRTTPENLAEIKRVLARIDHAPQRLRISVRQDVSGSRSASGARLSGDDHGVRYETLSTRAEGDENNVHVVQTLDGQPAFITTGQAVPLPDQTVVVTGAGAVVQDSIHYRDVSSGFYVVPHVNGKEVTLQIAPQLESAGNSGGAIDLQHVQSTVAGRLGQWIEIGGAAHNLTEDRGSEVVSTRRHDAQSRSIWVKVEKVE